MIKLKRNEISKVSIFLVIFYLLELGLEPDAPASTADRGVWISILNLAVAVTLVTWPGPAGEELREEPVLEP